MVIQVMAMDRVDGPVMEDSKEMDMVATAMVAILIKVDMDMQMVIMEVKTSVIILIVTFMDTVGMIWVDSHGIIEDIRAIMLPPRMRMKLISLTWPLLRKTELYLQRSRKDIKPLTK